MIYQEIERYCRECLAAFDRIPDERKLILRNLASAIRRALTETGKADLVYICTHNSRRSHFGQIWAQVASSWYNISGVTAYSGGTETTAFHPNAIDALKRVGFHIHTRDASSNPVYKVSYDEEVHPVVCFSKKYDHPANPAHDFIAIMTCSDAEENCPFIPNVRARLATTYDDPKAGDHGPDPGKLYDERCRQIACETLYAFSIAAGEN